MTTLDQRDPADLRRHPLHKAHVPAPDKSSPEWLAFADQVHAEGRIHQPITITRDGFVMDGWWRREAAHDFRFEAVPCIVRPPEEAPLLLVETLTARKQMTRGAAVYLALGLLPEYAAAAERRRLGNVGAGRKTNEERLVLSGSRSTPNTYLAARWGCNDKTVFQARLVRDILHDLPTFKTWLADQLHQREPDPAAAQLALRQEFEPLLFNGEKSLWTILQAIAGRLAGERKEPAAEQLDLFTRHWTALPNHWAKLSEAGRDVLAKKLPALLAEQPEEFLDLLDRSIAKARRQQSAA